jgi:hypothetical protein
MFCKVPFHFASAISLGLLLGMISTPQALEKVTFVGDRLTNEDGPFEVYGYSDLTPDGVLLASGVKSIAAAAEKAQNYLSARAGNYRAEIVSDDGKKKATADKEKPRANKKDFKEDKKAEPIPDPERKPFVDVGKAKEGASLAGTTWVGHETASDTTSLKFVFKKDGTVVAYDDITTWTGTWKLDGKSVKIELTDPHAVNYSGQIEGDQIKNGKAHRPGQRGEWSWSVTKE